MSKIRSIIGQREQNDQTHQHYHLNLFTNAEDHECRETLLNSMHMTKKSTVKAIEQELLEKPI